MSQISFVLNGEINEVAEYISVVGDSLTTIIFSEPGVGKSSILPMVKKLVEARTGVEYDAIYVDCPVKDMMDIAASIPNHDTRALEYYVSSLFKLTPDEDGKIKPKIIMLDEFAKAPKLLQVIFTRMMLELMVGDRALPAGSIVFGTSNNTTDGVGDAMMAHAGNRICKVQMRKPKADMWNKWAGEVVNGKPRVARSIRSWVALNPRALASYTDPDQSDNPFIFQPKQTNRQFVSPRSLAKSSVIIERKGEMTENMLMAGLAGTLGESAAKSIAAFVMMEDKLIGYDKVIKDPMGVSVPDDISVLVMMMFEALDKIEVQDDLNKFMQFVNRIDHAEVQAIFFTMVMRQKPRLGRYNQQITKWATENHVLM